MENKVNQIIGKTGLRDVFPGMSLKEVEKIEGMPESDEQGHMPYYEYEAELDEGEDLTIYHSYDAESKKIIQTEVFFYFFPAYHDESDEDFHNIKDLIIEKYTKDHGKPKQETKGSGSDKEIYYYWNFTPKKTAYQLVLMEYKDEDEYNPDDSKEVLKIVLNENH